MPVLEAEAHDEMSHLGPAPIGEDEVERFELGEIVGTLRPSLGEVVIAAPVEIAYVGQGQDVALDRAGRLPGDVRRPVAVGGRHDRAPPGDDSAEGQREDEERAPANASEEGP